MECTANGSRTHQWRAVAPHKFSYHTNIDRIYAIWLISIRLSHTRAHILGAHTCTSIEFRFLHRFSICSICTHTHTWQMCSITVSRSAFFRGCSPAPHSSTVRARSPELNSCQFVRCEKWNYLDILWHLFVLQYSQLWRHCLCLPSVLRRFGVAFCVFGCVSSACSTNNFSRFVNIKRTVFIAVFRVMQRRFYGSKVLPWTLCFLSTSSFYGINFFFYVFSLLIRFLCQVGRVFALSKLPFFTVSRYVFAWPVVHIWIPNK